MQRTMARGGLLALAVLAACVPLLRDPPRIDVVGVQLDRIDGPDVWFSVIVELTNVASDEIVIDQLQGRLAIEGETIANAALVRPPVRIAGKGSARTEMTAHTGMDSLLRAVASAMRRGATITAPGARPALRYAIDGSVTIRGGLRLPFARSGEIGERPR